MLTTAISMILAMMSIHSPRPQPASPALPGASAHADDSHADVDLVTALGTVAQGSEFTVGVHFKLDPHWHIYWDGVNDTGRPPTLTFDLPQGWTVLGTHWPAPQRLVTEIVLDHVYEQEVTILVDLKAGEVPAEGRPAAPDSQQTIKVSASYMICSTVCVFEKASAQIPVTVTAVLPRHAVRGDPQRLIQRAQARVPQALEASKEQGLTITPINEPAKDDKSLLIKGFHVPEASRLEFYPAKDCPPLPDLVKEGAVESDTIRLSVGASTADTQVKTPATEPNKADGSHPASGTGLKGVLAVWKKGSGGPAYYQVD